ncbi:MAG: hypothetical protein HY762_01195, partial [Planctomycetes bacterium]|nr:hypothetical protein [Planctomycetota bacterium]
GQAAPRTYRRLRAKIRTVQDFRKKIARPALKGYAPAIRPDILTKHKRTGKRVLEMLKNKLLKTDTARRYFANVKKTFQTVKGVPAQRFIRKLESEGRWYGESLARYLLPFTGLKGVFKGLAPLAVMWLTGNKEFWKYFRRGYPDIKEEPIMITGPDKKAEFSRALHNRLIQAGSQLVATDWDAELIRSENDLNNELVNKYITDEFVRFSTGGASHIDFRTEPAPDGKPKVWLDVKLTPTGRL